jgi:hypothetical protein
VPRATAQSVHDYGPDDPVEILHVHIDESARLIRIFNIVWIS